MLSEEAVKKAFNAGAATWPGLSLGFEAFARRVRKLGVAAEDLPAHGCDLYLASACAEGDRDALRVFEEELIGKVDVYVARSNVPREWANEVRQRVRVKLLVGKDPAIGRYRGEGPLGALVRVTAVRVAVDVVAAGAGRVHDGEIVDQLVSMDASPEVDAAKSLYGERFRGAIEHSLAQLSVRDKTLLRLHFVDGLNIDGIGAIYRVHRATVARWLVAIRGRVLEDFRSRLALNLGGTPSEVRSLVKLLRDDVQVSVKRLLGTR